MNKITASNQGCEDSPTLGSIKAGTIFKFLSNSGWRIKTNHNTFVTLSEGSVISIQVPSTEVTPLTGSICIETE